jgi:regulator of RNase E activity RraA
MDTVTPGSILFMSAPAGIPNAIYGGLMTMRARKLGAVGTVVDGRVRDLAEHREQGYPVFSRDLGITAGQEVCYSSEINVPVPLRSPDQPDVWINPGDIIVGDENGLACIPQNLEEEVMRLLPGLVERDRLCMEDLISGKTAEEVFRTRRGS